MINNTQTVEVEVKKNELNIIHGNIKEMKKLTFLCRKSSHPDSNNNLLRANKSIVSIIGRIKE
jgi:hypothetical protein